MKFNITVALLCLLIFKIYGQDTLHYEDVKAHHYQFELVEGKLVGLGADFLKSEFGKHQVIMLGEFHGLRSISEFTKSIIPILHDEGYRHFGLEVGPTMGKVLNDIPFDQTIIELNRLNQKYAQSHEDDVDTPIPFFSNVEDAAFLESANQNGWNVFGVDQEFISSYPMLLDIMYDNLTAMEKSTYANDHQMAQDTLASFYDRERNTDASYTMLIGKSITMKTYLDAMYRNSKNQAIVDAFRKSIEIYNYNRQRQWSKNYYTRMDYMKEQLKAEMDRTGFDFKKDKLYQLIYNLPHIFRILKDG